MLLARNDLLLIGRNMDHGSIDGWWKLVFIVLDGILVTIGN